MAGIQLQTAGGSVITGVAEAPKGLHTINKPQDYGVLGHYRGVFTTGTVAAGMAAGGELLQMRWIDTTRFCVIYEIEILEFRNITTAFAAGPYKFTVQLRGRWTERVVQPSL
jgi:hypothetical protein